MTNEKQIDKICRMLDDLIAKSKRDTNSEPAKEQLKSPDFYEGYKIGFESAQPKWISVQDELPKKWRENDAEQTLINYQIYSPRYGVDIGNYLKPVGRWVVVGIPVDDVTHWMPLPEPPKEEA